MGSPGRNDPCPCGSRRKFKKCCGANEQAAAGAAVAGLLADAGRLEQSGLLDQAGLRYQLALDQEPGNLVALYRLGSIRCRAGEHVTGAPLLLQAARRGKADAELCTDIAATLMSLGMAEEAVEVAARALKSHPGHVRLLLIEGTCLERLNRIEDALALLRRAARLAPADPAVAAAVARCYALQQRYREAEELLESSLRHNPADSPAVAPVWSELGKVRDKLGLHREAFDAISRYGQLTLADPGAEAFDTALRERQIALKREWILGGGLGRAARPPAPQPGARVPVFLVGFPRSGTTMTEQVLAAHSRVETSEEQPFLGAVFETLVRLRGTDLSFDEVLEGASPAQLQLAAAAYWERVEAVYGEGIDVFVDKLPLNILDLGLIDIVFPDARVIVALRDPRDVCLSCFFQAFALNASMKNFLRWDTTTAFYASVMDFYQAIKQELGLAALEIRYEDTVADLPAQARRLLAHIGVEWEEGVLEFHQQARKRFVNTPSYQAVREPVHSRARGRWKNYSGAMEAAEPDLERFIAEFGYAVAD